MVQTNPLTQPSEYSLQLGATCLVQVSHTSNKHIRCYGNFLLHMCFRIPLGQPLLNFERSLRFHLFIVVSISVHR